MPLKLFSITTHTKTLNLALNHHQVRPISKVHLQYWIPITGFNTENMINEMFKSFLLTFLCEKGHPAKMLGMPYLSSKLLKMGAFVGLWSFSTTKFQENSRSELLLQPALNRLSFLAQPFARNSDRLY